MTPIKSSPPKRATVVARIILSCTRVLLGAASVTFTLLLWHAYERASEAYRWTETPCFIIRSTVESNQETLGDAPEYIPAITYTYIVEENSYESKNVRRVAGQKFKEKQGAQEIVSKYPQGQGAICYVNPDDPKSAILMRETRAPLYSIWFPLLFVVGGLGMVINVWWPRAEEEIETPVEAKQPELTAAVPESNAKADSEPESSPS